MYLYAITLRASKEGKQGIVSVGVRPCVCVCVCLSTDQKLV